MVDTREWLLTNGLGSFASGTIGDARTRTYHGWLIAALDPPSQRRLLLSHLEASLTIGGQVVSLSSNFWTNGSIDRNGDELRHSFSIDPIPTWVWGRDWQLSRQLVMPYGLVGKASQSHRILIQYCYQGNEEAVLNLRPLIGDRDFHHQQSAEAGLHFSQQIGQQQVCLQAHLPLVGTPWTLRWSQGQYQPEGLWYWNYYYPEENRRGLGDREDLYSPGYLAVTLQPGETVTLEAVVGSSSSPNLTSQDFEEALQAEEQRLSQLLELVPTPTIAPQLLKAGDQFIAYRASIAGLTIIAGYPWFNDWGRDTLIALPGLTLTTGRFADAKRLLQTFGSYCQNGLIPNAFPDTGQVPIYNSIDASLWWIEILGLYLEATQDWDFLVQQYPIVRKIYKAFTAGTLYNIHLDATDGLVGWDFPGVAITWMDVVIDGQPITPRLGKPIEINALWYSALCWATQWADRLSKVESGIDPRESQRYQTQAQRYTQQAQQVKESLQKFWNRESGYLYDAIAPNDDLDPQIRPNAILALSLHHCAFPPEQGRQILQVAVERLLTPYGLRSLDPSDPDYIGTYIGDRCHRDRAYHQGTVWSWLIGSFIAAWERFYPSEPLPFNSKPLMSHFHHQACLGSVSEIFDGDPPHSPQGAIAQAWSVAELIRYVSNGN